MIKPPRGGSDPEIMAAKDGRMIMKTGQAAPSRDKVIMEGMIPAGKIMARKVIMKTGTVHFKVHRKILIPAEKTMIKDTRDTEEEEQAALHMVHREDLIPRGKITGKMFKAVMEIEWDVLPMDHMIPMVPGTMIQDSRENMVRGTMIAGNYKEDSKMTGELIIMAG